VGEYVLLNIDGIKVLFFVGVGVIVRYELFTPPAEG
jgi:hypothetical protein